MGRDRGFSPADRRAIVMAGVAEYRDRMRQAAGMGGLDAWYDHLEAGMLLKLVREEVRVKRVTKAEAQAFERDVNKAHTRDNTRVFTKRAAEVDGELRIVADPPLIIPIEDLVTPGSEWEDPAPLIKKLLSSLPAHPRARAPPAGGVPLRPHGLQDGRRGQRGDPLLHHADAGPRPQRPAVPADQGGAGLRARTVRRQEHLSRTTASVWWPASG